MIINFIRLMLWKMEMLFLQIEMVYLFINFKEISKIKGYMELIRYWELMQIIKDVWYLQDIKLDRMTILNSYLKINKWKMNIFKPKIKK